MVTDDDINSLSLAEALGVLQKLKAVSPALARLVQDAVGSEIQARVATGGEARQGKDKEWPELTAEEQTAAATLGYTQAGWEAGDEPLVCTIAWAELAEAMRAAAQVLGMFSLIADVGIAVSCDVFSGSTVAIGIASREGLGRTRHIRVQRLWIQEKVRDQWIHLRKVGSEIGFRLHAPLQPGRLGRQFETLTLTRAISTRNDAGKRT